MGPAPGCERFRVEQAASPCPLDQLAGQWVRADPGKTAYFSGVAYYFGKTIHHATGLPVGIINASWGGTPVEAWMSKQALSQEPRLKTLLERVTRSVDAYPARKAAFVEAFGQWLQTTGREDHVADPAAFAAPDIDTSSWQTVTLPGTVTAEGLPRLGAVWLRKEVTLPERCEGRKMEYEVNDITGFESVYWNGHKIGGIDYRTWPGTDGRRWYKIPAQYVKAGRNVLAVRLDAPVEPAAIRGYWNRLNGPQRVELKGPWLAKAEYALPDLTPRQKATAPASFAEPILERYRPSYLYNGMIHPLIPYGIRGVVWYQGENNVGDAALYRRAFPLLVQDWRSRWGEGDFPLLFLPAAQLQTQGRSARRKQLGRTPRGAGRSPQAPQDRYGGSTRPGRSEQHPSPQQGTCRATAGGPRSGRYLREEHPQQGSALFRYARGGRPHTYLLHPRRRADCRLTTDKAPSPAPTVENQNGSALTGFAICGTDRQWTWAEAQIDGDSVVVWSDQVPNPVAVRYAWADNPDGNLTNASGLPAAPFRTDGPQ